MPAKRALPIAHKLWQNLDYKGMQVDFTKYFSKQLDHLRDDVLREKMGQIVSQISVNNLGRNI